MAMTSGSGENPRDFSGECAAIFAADPTFSDVFDQPLFDDDPQIAALLRRSAFIRDFSQLYPDVDDVSGYSHRQVLKQAEQLDDDVIPTEAAAIGLSESIINDFIDHILRASGELGTIKALLDVELFTDELTTTKITFASTAWYQYEEACPWLLRMIDAAFSDGVQVSSLQKADIEQELFLHVGRTPAEQESYNLVETEIYAHFDELRGDDFIDDFADVDDKGELLMVLTKLGLSTAIAAYEQDESHPLTGEARLYLQRVYTRESNALNTRLGSLADAAGTTIDALRERAQPYYELFSQVASVGIKSMTQDDPVDFTPEEQSIVDDWFSTEDNEE